MTRTQVRVHCLNPRCAVLLCLLLAGPAAGDEVVKVYEDPAFDGDRKSVV